jgi:ribonuclease HI
MKHKLLIYSPAIAQSTYVYGHTQTAQKLEYRNKFRYVIINSERTDMASKKYYAVRKGKKTGIFTSWAECKTCIDGFSGAEYKGFATEDEAIKYMAADYADSADDTAYNGTTLLAYVDGSYNDGIKKYAFGCVFILPDGRIYTEFGNGDNPQSLEQRNVTGEMLGAMYAVRVAIKNGYKAVEICYDYQGIEAWVTGAWRSKNELTQKYSASMRKWGQSIKITFTKVAAHTNIKYNELADKTAKRGLTEGNGVPEIKLFEDMTLYTEEE